MVASNAGEICYVAAASRIVLAPLLTVPRGDFDRLWVPSFGKLMNG